MEDKKIELIQLRDNLYLMDEAHESTGYILIGEDKACVIDTMNGYNNLMDVVQSVTDKPVVVVNTHGHPDHIYGNVYFEKAYINPADLELADSFLQDPKTVAWLDENGLSMPPFEPIYEGDMIDLGGITLKVYEIPGHTKGGILLLCPEERVLFTGDSINHHLWMQLDHSLSIEETIPSIERLLFLEKEADVILHGHAKGYDDISLISAVLNGAKEILAGKTEQDSPYQWFDGVDRMHPFAVDETKKFQQNDHVICYREDNIYKK